jgi:hypothetical protein
MSVPFSTLNYFLVGWYSQQLDHYYLPSWKIWLSLLVIFNGVSNIAIAVLRYRTTEHGRYGRYVFCSKTSSGCP